VVTLAFLQFELFRRFRAPEEDFGTVVKGTSMEKPGSTKASAAGEKGDRSEGGAGGGAGQGGRPRVRPNYAGGIIVSGGTIKPPPARPVVLVTGGADFSSSPLSSAEIFDPDTSTWVSLGEIFYLPRIRHTATLLPGAPTGFGKVIVAGGVGNASDYQKTIVEEFDQATASWFASGRLLTSRSLVTATLLDNGRILVVGDADSCELYNPDELVWSYTASLNVPRQQHTATLLRGRTVVSPTEVLVVGGVSLGGFDFLASAEVYNYNPIAASWSPTASLPFPIAGHTATLMPNGSVLLVGGYDFESGGSGRSDCFFFSHGTWAPGPSMHYGRQSHTATLLPDGRLLVVGGSEGDLLGLRYYSAEILDSSGWTQLPPPSIGRAGHTSTLLPDGRVLIVGGGVSNACDIFNPSTNAWESGGNLNTNRAFHTATLLETIGSRFGGMIVSHEGGVLASM
jgi:Kelch motif/Galactose oxidase, central domain